MSESDSQKKNELDLESSEAQPTKETEQNLSEIHSMLGHIIQGDSYKKDLNSSFRKILGLSENTAIEEALSDSQDSQQSTPQSTSKLDQNFDEQVFESIYPAEEQFNESIDSEVEVLPSTPEAQEAVQEQPTVNSSPPKETSDVSDEFVSPIYFDDPFAHSSDEEEVIDTWNFDPIIDSEKK